jgi:hypothetical protein
MQKCKMSSCLFLTCCKNFKKWPKSESILPAVLRIRDPALFDLKDPGSGIIFFQISDLGPDSGSYCMKLLEVNVN